MLYAWTSVHAPGYVNVFLTLVYASWLAFLVHAACHLAKVRNPGRPFCEASQRWAEMTRLPQRFAVETVLGARAHLASRPEQLLMALSPLKSEQSNFATVKVYSVRLGTFISIEAAKRWFDGRNGGLERRMIVEYLRVPASALDRFMERLSRREHGGEEIDEKDGKGIVSIVSAGFAGTWRTQVTIVPRSLKHPICSLAVAP